MKDPHNYRKVGYSMIFVAGSLTIIGLLGLAIGEDVLFGDKIQRANTAVFENCKETGFVSEECQKFAPALTYDQCVKNQDMESPQCFKYRTWVESAIFEECRENRDIESEKCQRYVPIVSEYIEKDTETE